MAAEELTTTESVESVMQRAARLMTELDASKAQQFSGPSTAINGQPYSGYSMAPFGNKPIPDLPKVSKFKPPMVDYGATGTSFFGSLVQNDEYNPEWMWRDGILKAEEMRRNDAQIRAIEEMMVLPLLGAKWSIEPGSDDAAQTEIAAFVQSCLFDEMRYTAKDGTVCAQSWSEVLRHILLHLVYGFMPFELCYRIEQGYVKWSRWLPLLPRTVWRWYVDEDNELVGIQQWMYKAYTYRYVDIPKQKLILFVNRQEGQNYQGVSILRTAYKNWYYKQVFEKIAAIAIERNGIIPPVIKVPENASDGDVQAALQIAANLRANEQMGIVIGQDWDFEFPRNNQNRAEAILPLMQYHDVMIARNVLAQFVNLGSTETGAYNLDASQKQTFLNSLQGVATYISDVINAQAIRQLVDYNYGPQAVYPKLVCSKLVAQDLTTLATTVNQLAAYFPPSQPLNDYLADLVGVPKAPQNPVEAVNPAGPDGGTGGENGNGAEGAQQQDQQAKADTGNAQAAGGGGGGDAAASADGGDGGDGLSERLITEVALLREALDAAYSLDPVEKAMVFYNPYPRAPGGKFGTGGNHGEHVNGGGGSGGGEGETHGGGAAGEAHGGTTGARGGSGGNGSRSTRATSERSQKSEEARLARGKREAEEMHAKTPVAKAGKSEAEQAQLHQLQQQHEELMRAHEALKAEAKLEHVRPVPAPSKELVPVVSAQSKFDPDEKVTAYGLHRLYGDEQLRSALNGYTHEAVKEMAQEVMARNPGTRPTSMGKKDAVIDYIVGRVTGESDVHRMQQHNEELLRAHEALKAQLAAHRAERAARPERAPRASSASRAPRAPREPAKELVPVVSAQSKFDPDEKVTAYGLHRLYGSGQLRSALDGYTHATLKEMAQEVMRRNPGTKPKNMGKKDAVIDYIVGQLAGAGA